MDAALRSAARKRAEAELERQKKDRPRIEIGAAASEEDVRRFVQRIEEQANELEKLTEEYVEAAESETSWWLHALIRRLWIEACWIDRIGQFPDGRPMIEQSYWRLEMWGLILGGLARFVNKTEPDGDPDEALAALREQHALEYGLESEV